MTKRKHTWIRLLAASGACYALFAAQQWLPRAQALATMYANHGALSYVDANGCQVTLGIGLTNTCNSSSRTDGSYFSIYHHALPITTDGSGNLTGGGQFEPSGFPSSTSAYVALYCGSTGSQATYKGTLSTTKIYSCGALSFPLRSVCGASSVCKN